MGWSGRKWSGVILIVQLVRAIQTVALPEGNIMQAKDWRFPMACPLCAETAGTPYHASPEADAVRVKVLCSSCEHVWELVGMSSLPSLRPKPDRRRPTQSLGATGSNGFVARARGA